MSWTRTSRPLVSASASADEGIREVFGSTESYTEHVATSVEGVACSSCNGKRH